MIPRPHVLTVTTTVQTPFKANALERQLHRAVPGVGLAFIDQSLFGLLSRPEVPGSQHRNDFKVDQIVPAVDPGSQQFLVRRIHDLETASTCRIHPTRVVDNVVRQHSSVTLEALANELRVAMLEALTVSSRPERIFDSLPWAVCRWGGASVAFVKALAKIRVHSCSCCSWSLLQFILKRIRCGTRKRSRIIFHT
jgi:hypothetical protein